MERWRMMDPARVYERIEAQEQAQYTRSSEAKRERARQELEQLFGENAMGRKVAIAPHISTALNQWGVWADRRQFWANLNITPFCKLLGIGHGKPLPDVSLDPQSLKIHTTFMRMQCEVTRMVLIGYYVAGLNWDGGQDVYAGYGISRKAFYEILRSGSIALFNAAKL